MKLESQNGMSQLLQSYIATTKGLNSSEFLVKICYVIWRYHRHFPEDQAPEEPHTVAPTAVEVPKRRSWAHLSSLASEIQGENEEEKWGGGSGEPKQRFLGTLTCPWPQFSWFPPWALEG